MLGEVVGGCHLMAFVVARRRSGTVELGSGASRAVEDKLGRLVVGQPRPPTFIVVREHGREWNATVLKNGHGPKCERPRPREAAGRGEGEPLAADGRGHLI
jgi:hypothetical protein